MKRLRKITSLGLTISFLVMSYTGIMLFICPHGRVAYWNNWHLLGLSKDQYGQLHTTGMILFLFFGILHTYYNWKPLVSYLKDKTRHISFTVPEFLVALGINIIFIAGTLAMVQPFKAFIAFEENIKEYWAQEYGEPPYGHAEKTPLDIFCKRMDIPLDKAITALKEKGIKFSPGQSLETIARENNTTPSSIYRLIQGAVNGSVGKIPSKLGKRTLKELAQMGKIDLKQAMAIIKKQGITRVSPDTTIREIAHELNKMPINIYKLITKNNIEKRLHGNQ